jgi:hypothetical protein
MRVSTSRKRTRSRRVQESCCHNYSQAASAVGTGKTTAEMQTVSTFLDAGWGFTEETANGTDDIWWINEGKDYPRLWWQLDVKP